MLNPLRSGDLSIDIGRRLVTLAGEDIHLTPTEWEVLKYLAIHAGRVVTHAMVLRAVWGHEYGDEAQLLRYTVLQLRKKLHDDPVHPRFIFTDPESATVSASTPSIVAVSGCPD